MRRMGDRVVITDKNDKVEEYLHWTAARVPINIFLTFCKIKQYRDEDYRFSRLVQVIENLIETNEPVVYYSGDHDVFYHGFISRVGGSWSDEELLEGLAYLNQRQPTRMRLTFEEVSEFYLTKGKNKEEILKIFKLFNGELEES